jgi:hypothetical protein
MPIYKISLNFARLSAPQVVVFTGGIIDGLTGNPAYLSPAVSMPDLTAAQTTLSNAITAQILGGPVETAAMNTAKVALVALLRLEANYVQGAGKNDLSALLSSGFSVNSNNRTRSPLATPNIIEIDNGMTTQLIARVQGVDNARAYEAQVKNGTGGWLSAGIFSQSRNMILPGLTPGSIYSVQVRAIGGSTGYSDWSDPVSHMAM